jgi:1,4-dihydroxy-2-naphthoate octaprenyltransferase
LLAFLFPLVLCLTDQAGPGVLLASAVVLLGAPLGRRMFVVDDGPSFNRLLAATARLQALYALAFAVGVVW